MIVTLLITVAILFIIVITALKKGVFHGKYSTVTKEKSPFFFYLKALTLLAVIIAVLYKINELIVPAYR